MDGAHADDFAGRARDCRDDAAAQIFPDRFARAEELPGEVHADDFLPLRECHVLEGGVLLQPGVVDQNVDRSKRFQHFREHRLHFIFVADIGLRPRSLRCRCARINPTTRSASSGAGDVIHRHGRAGRAEGNRAGFADPGICTGDERFLILQWM